MVSRSRSPWRGLSIDELVKARTAGLHMAYGGRLLKLDKRHILGHSFRRLSLGLAISISGQSTLLSCQCRNALQEDHCGDDLRLWNG